MQEKKYTGNNVHIANGLHTWKIHAIQQSLIFEYFCIRLSRSRERTHAQIYTVVFRLYGSRCI